MEKKSFIICIILILIIVLFIILNSKPKDNDETYIDSPQKIEVIKDEKSDEYIIYNKSNGEEIARSKDEGMIYIYEIDPNYDPHMEFTFEQPKNNP